MLPSDMPPRPDLAARAQPVTPSTWMAGVLIAGLLLLTAIALGRLIEWEPLISDSIGYLYAAQRIAAGFGPTYDDPNNALAGPYFSLYAFQVRHPDSALMYLGFPPGLSFLLAIPLLIEPLAGLVHWVIPATALLSLGLSGALAWKLSGRAWAALWAVLVFAVTPELWRFGTAIWSEFPSAAMMTAALALYLMAERRPVSRRVETVLLAVTGLLLGYSVFVRYANLVVLPVFLLADALLIRKHPQKLASHWPLWLLSGLTVVLIPVFNHFYYGGWNLTSYSPVHGWYPNPAFSLTYALGPSFIDGYSLRAAMTTLWRNFGIFLLLAPVGWMFLGRAGAMLAGIALMLLSIYAVYAFAPTGINARFMIPMFPMLAIGAGVALVNIGASLPRPLRLALGVGLLLLAVWRLPTDLTVVAQRNRDNARHVALMQTLTASTPENAVFMSYPWNDLLAVYGDRAVFTFRRVPVSDAATQRYYIDAAVPTIISVITTLLEQGKSVYYVATGSDFVPGLPDTLQAHFTAEATTVEGITVLRLALAPTP
jgi:hypothetical protein